jgi:hypothetical protein
MERSDLQESFHEPFSVPYYYGPEGDRISERYPNEPAKSSFSEISEKLKGARARMKAEAEATGSEKVVFVKDMSYYLGHIDDGTFNEDLLLQVTSLCDACIFLIRDPAKQVNYCLSIKFPQSFDSFVNCSFSTS